MPKNEQRTPRVRYVVRHTDPHSQAHVRGMFVKIGGGVTPDISEAQVIGWSNHRRWVSPRYELIPVAIISVAKYNELVDDQKFLDALRTAGVDNWIDFDEAIDILNEGGR